MLYCILVTSCWCNSLRMQRMHFIVEFCIYLCNIAAVSWLLWGFNGPSLACWPLNKCVPVTHIGRSLLWASYGSPELALSQNHPDQTRPEQKPVTLTPNVMQLLSLVKQKWLRLPLNHILPRFFFLHLSLCGTLLVTFLFVRDSI